MSLANNIIRNTMNIRLGTRESALALAQANAVKQSLEQLDDNIQVELVLIKTLGCRKQGTDLASQSDKKDWVHELELALLDHNIDFAVHSAKDIPYAIEPGTTLLSTLKRASPMDVFIGRIDPSTRQRVRFDELPQGATVGTASLRRQAQLLMLRPDLHCVEHRGNVPTRIKKLDDSDQLHGIVLACAGIERLSIEGLQYVPFNANDMMPALNQGTLAVQFRESDYNLASLLANLVHPVTQKTFIAERTVAEILKGDCHSAISIYATCKDSMLTLASRVMSPDGQACVEVSELATIKNASELGVKVGEILLAKGADKIIAATTAKSS